MLAKSTRRSRDGVGITKWQDYYILNQQGTVAEVTTWNDEAEFADCHESLFSLGFSDQQRGELYTMLALCLNLGNLTFNECKEGSEIPDPEAARQVRGGAAGRAAAPPGCDHVQDDGRRQALDLQVAARAAEASVARNSL